jgi:hypothetical protein
MTARRIVFALLIASAAATPAMAQASEVAEPSSLLLLGLAVAGVIIGRQSGRRRNDP